MRQYQHEGVVLGGKKKYFALLIYKAQIYREHIVHKETYSVFVYLWSLSVIGSWLEKKYLK